jgi:GNAT superfamily N-acetyltransferase
LTVTTTWLEIDDPAALVAAPPVPAAAITMVADPSFNRDLYARVGARWSWTDRLVWGDEEWAAWAARVETWVARVAGDDLAGYYELDRGGGSVEIAIFGLLPGFERRGLGGWLLTHAIRRGFELGAGRVWVHTSSLDAPGALPNYMARGMRVVARRCA